MEKIHGGEKKVAIKYPAMEVSGLALKYGFFENSIDNHKRRCSTKDPDIKAHLIKDLGHS